ncbi:hypothetical protein MPSEU_000249300 [Mayamaea pseudoterrestris]|nr:hypothetical protein MPSEU_000249300 [Mayamaea pseudoterrestris]
MYYSSTQTDNVGRSFCQSHGRESCHECMVDFTRINRFAEENAGLRPKPSRTEELQEEKAMLLQGISFILSQDASTQSMMKENLDYHHGELRRVENELTQLQPSAVKSNSHDNQTTNADGTIRGWRAVWGTCGSHLALFRLVLGGLLVIELTLRFRFLRPFYSDEGTLPLRLLVPKVDDIYRLVCVHCRFGKLWEQYVLLSVELVFAILFTLGIFTRFAAAVSWFMYLSLTLRNTWMSYILDRYFHYLLFLSIFLPWSEPRKAWTVNPATVALKILLCWIYFDAGYGKLMDPLGGWTYGADPLPALDTYARHTLPAQYLYALVGPHGLRVMTPVVVWVELLATPVAMLGLHRSWMWMVYLAVTMIVSMHVGIALCLRNSTLLSLVACAPWCLFLPPASDSFICLSRSVATKVWYAVSIICLLIMAAGNVWLYSDTCQQSVKHIWSTVFHNRWNVFVGAEEYVTWEIAPGELQDGSTFVDVWGRRDQVSWQLPGDGAPCTATARPGRWRSFPYLAGLEGEDGEALWSYLCKEWDRENKIGVDNLNRHLVRFNFFMLQADILPNMGFTETRKRLVHSYECPPLTDNTSRPTMELTSVANGVDEVHKDSMEFIAQIRDEVELDVIGGQGEVDSDQKAIEAESQVVEDSAEEEGRAEGEGFDGEIVGEQRTEEDFYQHEVSEPHLHDVIEDHNGDFDDEDFDHGSAEEEVADAETDQHDEDDEESEDVNENKGFEIEL